MTKIFRGHTNGFTFVTSNLGETQSWIEARKIDCKGHVLRLNQGVGTVATDGAITATYGKGSPSREAVL
jgi:hypothetical protein